jgi:hypothetical protein
MVTLALLAARGIGGIPVPWYSPRPAVEVQRQRWRASIALGEVCPADQNHWIGEEERWLTA